jgi:hypothetical protein
MNINGEHVNGFNGSKSFLVDSAYSWLVNVIDKQCNSQQTFEGLH